MEWDGKCTRNTITYAQSACNVCKQECLRADRLGTTMNYFVVASLIVEAGRIAISLVHTHNFSWTAFDPAIRWCDAYFANLFIISPLDLFRREKRVRVAPSIMRLIGSGRKMRASIRVNMRILYTRLYPLSLCLRISQTRARMNALNVCFCWPKIPYHWRIGNRYVSFIKTHLASKQWWRWFDVFTYIMHSDRRQR